MDKLHTILYDSSLAIVEQDTSTVEGYSSLQNYYRAIAPFNTEYIPYVIFYPTNTADNVGVPAEYLLMELIEPVTVDGSTYYAYETNFPPAVTGSARATKIDVTIAFIVKDDNLIGVSRYDETEPGYNDTTYIAAQLLIDYDEAVADQYVRVFNTETDWVFNGTLWTDTDDITITDLIEHRSDTATYTLRKGTSTTRPTHAPNNTESIIAILNTKISSSEAYANFYTKTDSDARFVNTAGDTMTANLTLPSMTLYNANGNAVFTMDDEGVVRVAQGGIDHELGENLFVRGDEVGTILNGDTIMYDGSIGASGKMNVVTITSANIATLIANPHFFLGIATQNFSGIQNRLNWYGGVSDLATTTYTSNVTYPAGEGKEIYVDMVNGGLTYIRPAKPLPVIQVGVVVTYHATQGRILVRPNFSTALSELHDVNFNGYTFVGGETILYNLGNASWQIFDLAGALLSIENDKEDKSNKGIANGYTPLNSSTKIDSTYLPSYVDDVLEVATYADLPATGESGILYIVIADETSGGNTSTYRWATTVYVQITDTLSSAEVKVLYEANSNTNAYTDADKAKLAGITVPTKTSDLTNDGNGTGSAFTTFDDVGDAGYGDMTEGEYAQNAEEGVVDEAVLARTAQQTIVVPLTKGTLGKYYATVAGFSLILNNQFTLLFPNSTTDLTENVSVSLGGIAGTYKDLKYDDTLNNVIVKHTINAKVTAYYDNTEFLIKGEPLIDLPFTFDSSINSIYGEGKAINGSSQLNKFYGLSLNSIAYDQDVVDTGTINFDSVSGIDYYDWLNSVIIAGTGSNIVVTNNTGATADMMVVVISNTPIASKTAPQINAIIPTYFEDYTYIVNPELWSRGLQLFNEVDYTTVDYAYKIRVNPSSNVAWSVSTQYKLYDIGLNEISTSTALTVATTSETAYIAFVGTMSSPSTFMLNEGTTAEDWQTYNSPQDNFKLHTNLLSVGSIRDEAYELNGVWWKKQFVGIDLNDILQEQTSWGVSTVWASVTRFTLDLTSLLDYVIPASDTDIVKATLVIGGIQISTTDALSTSSSLSGNDYEHFAINNTGIIIIKILNSKLGSLDSAGFEAYLQANNVKLHYELNTPLAPVEIEKDGSLIQEANTTLVQLNNFATEYDITFAGSVRKLVEILNDKIIALRNEMETVRWTDLRTPMTQALQGNTQKPDFDYTNIGLLFPQNDATEIVYTSFQMPHSYKEGSNIRPHIHIGQALDLQAVFKIEYKWVNIGDTLPATWTTLTLDQYAIEYASDTLHNILYSTAEVDGTGMKISSIFKAKLYRDDNVYTGDMLVSDFDIHYQEDSNGSRQEYVK